MYCVSWSIPLFTCSVYKLPFHSLLYIYGIDTLQILDDSNFCYIDELEREPSPHKHLSGDQSPLQQDSPVCTKPLVGYRQHK